MHDIASQPRRRPRRGRCAVALFGLATLAPSGGNASVLPTAPASSPGDAWSYADLADLVLTTPIVLTARVAEAIPLREPQPTPSRPGTVRTYIVANVETVIRGPAAGVAPTVRFLAHLPLDVRGKPPKLKKAKIIVAAIPVAGRPDELRLAARDGLVAWSDTLERRMRSVIAAGLATDAPPAVTGIASAFHTAGTLPGEGETQVFLSTADARPVSLSILRRPGQAPSWSLALGEIVDEAARPPARDTLGWYRLACFLPPALPGSATGELSADDAGAAREDYAFVIASLGGCRRTRG